MVEDYRAGPGIDRRHEEADRATGRRVARPTLLAVSVHDELEYLYGDPLAIWRDWADDVRQARIDSGRHMAEEVAAALRQLVR